MDDEELILSALAGNSAAFGDLVRKYQDRLYNSMTHLMGCAEDAQDVVQDAFVKAFLHLNSFKRASGFYTWLYRIAFNAAMSRQRRIRPITSLDARQDGSTEPLDAAAAPGERLEKEELADQVRGALKSLSNEHRTVLVLRDIDGCDYDSISQVLEIPIGTVRSRLHRARLELRDQLKKVMQTDLT